MILRRLEIFAGKQCYLKKHSHKVHRENTMIIKEKTGRRVITKKDR
jgi:hypothetical protein